MSKKNAGEVLVPLSIGELLDKITILQIKAEKIKDEGKLKNINKELSALISICKQSEIDVNHVLVIKLKQINQTLWVVEDKLRDLEQVKQFDAAFVQLARDVYFTNDTRAAVKKELNLLLGSSYVEEKSYKPYT